MNLPTNEPSDRAKWMVLIAAVLGWMFDGMEMGLFPLVATPAINELLGGVEKAKPVYGTWFSVVIAVFLVGAACGGILFGWLGDRYGRVRAMTWSVLTYSLCSGLWAFAPDIWSFTVMRFVAALGMGGEWSLGVALVMEVWPAKSRPLMAGVIGAASNAGFLLIALFGLVLAKFLASLSGILGAVLPQSACDFLLGNGGWRLLMLLSAFPALLTFFISLVVPESERWKEASKSGPKVRIPDIFANGLAKTTLLGTSLAAIALLGTWGSTQWLPAWAGELTKKLAESTPEQVRNNTACTQICSAIGAIIGTLGAAWISRWFMRRPIYFALCLASLLTCAWLFRVPISYGGGFLAMVVLVGGLTAAFYGWLPLYLPELFPTRLRATAQGFAFNFGRIFAAAGTFVSSRLIGPEKDFAGMCSVVSLIYIAGLVVIWFCPETKDRPLPE